MNLDVNEKEMKPGAIGRGGGNEDGGGDGDEDGGGDEEGEGQNESIATF